MKLYVRINVDPYSYLYFSAASSLPVSSDATAQSADTVHLSSTRATTTVEVNHMLIV